MAHARRTACYNVCATLAESGFLEPASFLLPPRRPSSRAQGSGNPREPDSVSYIGMQVYPRKAPLFWSNPRGALSDVADHIPWALVTRGALSWSMPLKYGRAEDVTEDIEDAVIQDRSTELTRRYDVLRVRSDLSPLSRPEDSPREAKYGSLLEYCKFVRKNFEGLKDEGQAIIEVSSVMRGVSRLDPASHPPGLDGPPPPRYLIPELCLKFTIPASTFRTALLFPSIIRRLDSFLLVKELNARFFNHQISETLLDMAITTPSTRMEYDYERLEFLGDSFLKYLSSIYVFVNEPSNKEGALHIARQQIVSNSTLFRSCDTAGLPSYVQSKPFSSKSWQPPNFRTSEENVAEAILGAAYLSGGSDTALMAAKAMNIPFPNVEKWSDFGRKLLIPPPTISAKLKPGALQEHPYILAQALTHASVSGYERVSYERLEFGAMVSNSALAAVCISSGLYNHLLLATRLTSSVTDYMEKLKIKQTEEYELARLEKRSPGQYWQEIEPPKVLSDVVESVIGAIYVSDNFTPVGVEAFFESVLKPFYDKHITLKTVAHHPTKILFELIQAQKCQKFELLKEKGPSGTYCHVLVHEVILASGEGPSISLAARNASWCALDALEGDAEFLRICDCPKLGDIKDRSGKGFDDILSGLEE
ncbi:ribonuclease III [Mycena leptocephala]|nr:ribonuclease III [Mycena leptocephala]